MEEETTMIIQSNDDRAVGRSGGMDGGRTRKWGVASAAHAFSIGVATSCDAQFTRIRVSGRSELVADGIFRSPVHPGSHVLMDGSKETT